MNLPSFSVKKPVTVLMATVMVFIFGMLSLSRLGLDLMPDMDFPTISVITSYSGASPEDVENSVTELLEGQISSVENVKSVSSTSSEGISMIMVEFNDGTDVDTAAQDIQSSIELVRDYLPSDVDSPVVMKMDIGAMPVVGYGVTSDSMDSLELKNFLEENIEDQMERLEGVASVVFQGAQDREIAVELDRDKMESYGISQSAVVAALQYENLNYSGGSIDQGLESLSLRTMGEFENLDEIRDTVIDVRDGVSIYIKDIATVSDTTKEVKNYCRTNQKESVLMFVSKSSDANTLEVADAAKEKIAELEDIYGDKIEFALVMDQSTIISNSVNSVKESGVLGGILAIVIVYLFLRSWRPTLAIGLAIPFSLVATFIPIYLVGYSLNIMTLGGLVLGIGMFVDNAVVVIENIFRHMEEKGVDKKKAAIKGANEVRLAILASTLTTVVIFLPMAFVEGVVGEMTKSLSLTVVFALFCSLLVAVTLIPMLASKIFKKENAEKCDGMATGRGFMGKVEGKYKVLLVWSLKNRGKVLLSTLAALVLSVMMILSMGGNFMPDMENNLMIFHMTLPAGSSLEYVDETAKEIEAKIEDKVGEQFESMTVIAGGDDAASGGGGMSKGSNSATFIFYLKNKDERTMEMEDIKEAIRSSALPIKGLDMQYYDISSSMLGGGSSEVEIKIFGNDMDEIKRIGNDIAERIDTVEGVEDVDISLKESKPEVSIDINRELASQYGLTVGGVGSYVKSFMQGQVATQFRKGDEETNIRVRFSEDYRDSLQKVKDMNLTTTTGEKIFLKQIAEISESQGFVEIMREDQVRKMTVTANTSGRDLDAITEDINASLEDMDIPDGYFVENGGSYEQMQDSFIALGYAMILGMILVYMVMASQFESLLYPFIVMFEIPLSFIGVGLIFFVTGQSLTMPAMMGIVVLAGIVVNNAIVLIDYINQLREKGEDMNEAIVQAGLTRLRPILITSLTTVLGMVPLATSTQEGSELMKPMAIAVVGGLMVSTILTLVVIPVIYNIFDRFSRKKFGEEI